MRPRPYEAFFSVFIYIGLMGCLLYGPHRPWLLVVSALAICAFLIQLIRQRPHWQRLPGYIALALLVAALSTGGKLRISFACVGLLALFSSDALCWALPMFNFAPLTGPHRVGTSIHHCIDRSREDASPSGHRELMIQLWYPAAFSRNKFAPYRRKLETTRISSYQSVLRTSSRLDAQMADGNFPVLLFNPAWNGRRTQNTFLTEELASHGFVVAAVDHTYNSEPVAFPDGRVVWANHIRAMEDVATTTSEEIQRIGNAEVDKQALDCRFVLDELARWNAQQGSQWQGRLDTDNAGAFGHSLGGAVAIECWATDPRIQAAMNLDGWTFGSQASSGRRKAFSVPAKPAPLLFVYEGNYNPLPEKENSGKSETEQQVDIWDATHVRQLLEHHGGFMFKLHGADHMNFTDRTISSPLRRLAGGGSIDPRVAHRILRDYAVQFLNQALRGLPSPLLEGRQSYVEISVPGVEMQPS